MLAGAGLVEGEDYETVLLDGFDPLAHIAIDGIVGFPGYKSNEPGRSTVPASTTTSSTPSTTTSPARSG